MSTRKVKDAKDLSSNELIYFRGHAKATYMSDGSTVETVVNNINDNISSGRCSAYSEVKHGSNDTTFTLTPYTFHVWDKVPELTLTLSEETDNLANEYLFQFTSGSTPTILSLPANINWVSDFTIEPNRIYQVSILKGLGNVLSWDRFKSNIYYYNYFTIEALEDDLTVSFCNTENIIKYRIDNGEWTSLKPNVPETELPASLDTDTVTPAVKAGQKIQFKMEDPYISDGNVSIPGIGTFTMSKQCNVSGNIMSLLYGDDFIGKTILPALAFCNLFCYGFDYDELIPTQYNIYIQNAKNLILPSTTVSFACYSNMFAGCTGLITAPELPATTLAEWCYDNMFSGCTGLAKAPELPATTLADSCYHSMFRDCTSLTVASELPATNLADWCYADMFRGCTSLTEVPELPATTLAAGCYSGMFDSCGLTTAPELHATNLATDCYQYMFWNCSNLNYIKMLATNINADNCLTEWVSDVSSTGTFVKHPDMTSLPTGIDGIPEGWEVEDIVIDYSAEYLTITALEDNLMTAFVNTENIIEYRIDNGEWTYLYPEESTPAITPAINAGQKIQFKIDNPTISSSYGIGAFTMSNQCNVSGNIMSLLYGDDFIGKTTLPECAFYKLFCYNPYQPDIVIQNAENLILPATTLAERCYYYMFQNCTGLTSAPELPATYLAEGCYQGMFSNCTGLTSAPELPATNLANDCYSYMFSGCTELTSAPELPATTLASNCYYGMFNGCTGLTTAPELPATTLVAYCYSSMFEGCTGLTTAPELPATTLAEKCYASMFSNCTGLTSVPELPATTLADWCYDSMFYNCTSLTTTLELLPATTLAGGCYANMFRDCTGLTTAPELPATTLANYCYRYMFDGCTNLTTAPELPATILTDFCYQQMLQNCMNLNYIKMLATDISAEGCLYYWVNGVSSTGTFVKHPDMTSLSTGVNGIPSGWTVEDYQE